MAELGSSFTFSGHHSRTHFSSRDIKEQFVNQVKTAAEEGRVYDIMQLFLRELHDNCDGYPCFDLVYNVGNSLDTACSNFDRLNDGVQRNDIVALTEAFAVACHRGRLNDVKRLSHVVRDDVDMLGTGLHFASLQRYVRCCKREHWKIIRWLMENTKLQDNPLVLRRALVMACEYNKIKEVRWMIQYRQLARDIATVNEGISYAHSYGYVAVMKCLLEHTNVDVNNTEARNTLLHDVIWQNRRFKSKFHDACRKGDVTEMYRLVCECGANVNEQDNYGYTPLHRACSHGYRIKKHTGVIEALMMLGADVNITNDYGRTPAQEAIYCNHKRLLPLLDRTSLMDTL